MENHGRRSFFLATNIALFTHSYSRIRRVERPGECGFSLPELRLKRMKKKQLSPKQRKFVAEYLKDQNAKQAAIRAGYSKRSAEQNGPRLLSNAEIKAAVESSLHKAEDKAIVSVAYVLQGLKEVAERSLTAIPKMEFDYEEKEMVHKQMWIEDPENPGKTKLVGVFEFDSAGANRAFELIGKHLKMFTDKVDLGAPNEFFERLESALRKGNDFSKTA